MTPYPDVSEKGFWQQPSHHTQPGSFKSSSTFLQAQRNWRKKRNTMYFNGLAKGMNNSKLDLCSFCTLFSLSWSVEQRTVGAGAVQYIYLFRDQHLSVLLLPCTAFPSDGLSINLVTWLRCSLQTNHCCCCCRTWRWHLSSVHFGDAEPLTVFIQHIYCIHSQRVYALMVMLCNHKTLGFEKKAQGDFSLVTLTPHHPQTRTISHCVPYIL